MDYNALIGDADKRNETFLSIIQNTFKESVEEGKLMECLVTGRDRLCLISREYTYKRAANT